MWIFLPLVVVSCIGIEAAVEYQGHRGETLEIRCPYKPRYESNTKYLCKGSCTFRSKNIVVQSGSRPKDERFSLIDDRKARVFTITITDLRKEDAGQYWCGVNRKFHVDDYSEVYLLVKPAERRLVVSTTIDVSTAPLSPVEEKPAPDSTLNSILIILIFGGMFCLLLTGAVSLAVAVRRKKQTQGDLVCTQNSLDLSSRNAQENDYERMKPIARQNSQRVQSCTRSEEGGFCGADGSDLCGGGAVPAGHPWSKEDQTYMELNSSRLSELYHSLMEEEPIYQSFE